MLRSLSQSTPPIAYLKRFGYLWPHQGPLLEKYSSWWFSSTNKLWWYEQKPVDKMCKMWDMKCANPWFYQFTLYLNKDEIKSTLSNHNWHLFINLYKLGQKKWIQFILRFICRFDVNLIIYLTFFDYHKHQFQMSRKRFTFKSKKTFLWYAKKFLWYF